MFCARNTFLNASQQRDFCVQRPQMPKNFPPAAGADLLGGLCFLYKTHPKSQENFACGGHWGPSFRFAKPAPIGRSPAKRKNLVNPGGAVLFFMPAAGKTYFLVLPIVFIRKTIGKTDFFRAFGPNLFASRVYARRRRKFFRCIPLFEGKVYHFRGINRSLNEGKTMRGGRKRCKIFRGRVTAPERV